jgi:plastocyanin
MIMVVMGINMLGIFPQLRRLISKMPKIFSPKRTPGKSNSPLIVGLLNGLMPCGPLQAMQIYALSTGNPFTGAASMFLFGLGTVPLMFGLGALSSALGGRFSRRAATVGAILVVALGMSMFAQGWNLSGLGIPSQAALDVATFDAGDAASAGTNLDEDAGGADILANEQIVNSVLASGRYPDITVQAGTSVRWVIDAPQGSVNGCNNRMYIQEYGIEHQFETGENIIEFVPDKTGTFRYSCWMGMISGTITVV